MTFFLTQNVGMTLTYEFLVRHMNLEIVNTNWI
jgi:hypothetical protein